MRLDRAGCLGDGCAHPTKREDARGTVRSDGARLRPSITGDYKVFRRKRSSSDLGMTLCRRAPDARISPLWMSRCMVM